MRDYERRLGHPLAGPQIDSRFSHINDNPVGAWRSHLGAAEFQIVVDLCRRLNIPLDLFRWD
jgi:hypothetical protein